MFVDGIMYADVCLPTRLSTTGNIINLCLDFQTMGEEILWARRYKKKESADLSNPRNGLGIF